LVEKKAELGQVATAPGLNFFLRDIPSPELMVLAISDIRVGEQILPVNAATVEAFSLTRAMNIVGIKPLLVAIRA
jgi:hypothetical protein